MTPTTALGLSIRLSMFELRETGDWDIFLGPPERVRVETGGADQWVLKRRECSGFPRVNSSNFRIPGIPTISHKFQLKLHSQNSTLKRAFHCGVPSSQALPDYLITAHYQCAFLLYLAR